jgi:hypothetical protein
MGWNKMPMASGTMPSGLVQSVREFEWLVQFWEAVREREWVLGHKYWPRQSQSWYTGTIGAMTDNTLTNASGLWLKTGTNNPWTGTVNSDPFAPPSWGVFIEAGGYKNYRKVLYADIVDWTSGNPGTLYIPKIQDYIVSKEITSTSELVGKEFFIVRKHNITANKPSLRWSDRWPQFPNTDELIYGDITSGSASGYIVDNTKHFFQDQYAGNELAIRDGSGYLHRVPIIAHPSGGSGNYLNPSDPNFEHTIFFQPVSWTPTGHYAILAGSGTGSGIAGNVYRIGREKHQPWAWYRGAMDQIWAHFPVYQGSDQGFLGKTYTPASQVVWNSKRDTPPFDCIPQNHPGTASAFDLDMWSDIEEECGAPLDNDRSYSPHIYKTWRSLQEWLETNCVNFIEKKSYDNEKYLFKFTPSAFFRAAGIGNTYQATITGASGGPYTQISNVNVPWTPMTMYYSLFEPTNTSGYPLGMDADYPEFFGSVVVSRNPATSGLQINLPFTSGYINYRLELSTGWKRFVQRRFKNKDKKTNFIPDVDPDTGGVIDPARVNDWDTTREFGVGHWRDRIASSGYVEEVEGPLEFQEGDVAWYVGSSWNDPIDGGNAFSFLLEPTAPYYDRAYEGVHPEDLQHDRVYAQIYGTVHEGSVYRLADYAKNWWQDVWYTGGIGHVETGTVTGGTTTSMEDNTKKVDQQSGAFWTQRFSNASGIPYLDFIIEFLLPTQFTSVSGTTDTENRWHKRPISFATADTSKVTARWTEPLPSDPTSKTWRIREPKYEINRWRDYLVYIKYKTGHLVRTFATYSDDNTLYFNPPLPSGVSRGDAYSIIYPHAGNTYQYTTTTPSGLNTLIAPSGSNTTMQTCFKALPSGYWVHPRGADSVRMGVAVQNNWHTNPNENLPTIVKRYGRFSRYDCTEIAEFYDQIYRGVNALVWTKGAAACRSSEYPPPSGQEYNTKDTDPMAGATVAEPGGGPCGTPPSPGQTAAESQALFNSQWDGTLVGFSPVSGTSDTCPSKLAGLNIDASEVQSSLSASYAWIEVLDPPTAYGELLHSTDVYLHTTGPKASYGSYVNSYIPEYTFFPNPLAMSGVIDPGVYVGSEFDNQGDNVYKDRWGLMATRGPLTDFGPRIKVGNINRPPHYPRPPATSELTYTLYYDPDSMVSGCLLDDWTAVRGYTTDAKRVIHRWDVTGGMTYISPSG